MRLRSTSSLPQHAAGNGMAVPPSQQQQQQRLSHENFISYVLYTIPDNEKCTEAIMLAAGNSEIHNQNVYELGPGKRPAWLKSVPALYSKQENKIYLGSVCLAKLNTLLQNMGPMPASFINSAPINIVSAMTQSRYGNSAAAAAAASASNRGQDHSSGGELLSNGTPAADPGQSLAYADSSSSKSSFALFIPNVSSSSGSGGGGGNTSSTFVSESKKVTSSDIEKYTSMRARMPVPSSR